MVRMKDRDKRLIALVEAKYREDPEGLAAQLPGLHDLMPAVTSSGHEGQLTQTRGEIARRKTALAEALAELRDCALSPEGALVALEHIAHVIADDPFTDAVDHATAKALFKRALGKSPGSFRAKAIIAVGDGEVVHQTAVMRGVYLGLNKEGCLAAITVNPGKVREFRKLMKFVGAGWDPNPDVAARHDDYLAMQDPHGGT